MSDHQNRRGVKRPGIRDRRVRIAMALNEQIFDWEGISVPSYWGGNLTRPGGLAATDQIVATGANTVTIIPNFSRITFRAIAYISISIPILTQSMQAKATR